MRPSVLSRRLLLAINFTVFEKVFNFGSFENKLPARVTGIIKDLPNNSHLQFDCVVPYLVMKELGFDLNDWYNWNPRNYIKLSNASNPDDVSAKVQAIVDNNRKNTSTETCPLIFLMQIFMIQRKHLAN